MTRKVWIWLGAGALAACVVATIWFIGGRPAVDRPPPGTPGHAIGAASEVAASAVYARADSTDDLNMAREAERELKRLRPVLETLDDDVLAAYASYGPGTLPIGTYLQSKGYSFAVLTEPMLVLALANEMKRRETERANRWSLISEVVLAVIAAILGYAAHYLQTLHTMPGKATVEVSHNFTGNPDIGNEVIIRNLSSTPMLITHWALRWRRRRWLRWEQIKEIVPDEFFKDIKLNGHASMVLSFQEENYFDWSVNALNGAKVYLQLNIAGREKPIMKEVYG